MTNLLRTFGLAKNVRRGCGIALLAAKSILPYETSFDDELQI